jgi:uncharacterized protein (TIGR00255 family)
MTGFGVGSAALGGARLVLEIRSVNHRYLDVRVRLPVEIGEHAFFLEQAAREKLARGRYDVSGRLEGARESLSFERARAAYATLQKLRDELAPGTELPITAVLSLPEVTQSAGSLARDEVQAALVDAFGKAHSALGQMRSAEGEALARELGLRVKKMRELCQGIRGRSGEALVAQRTRLKTRLDRLLEDAKLITDPGRLELELAILADKSDITEELVRLDSHLSQLDALIADAEPVGRRLDFLLQEVAREANTIGSKSQDTSLSHQVVELKSEIERMREQVQNVE